MSSFSYDPANDVCYRTLDFLGFLGYRVGDDGSVWSRKKTGSTTKLYDRWTKLSAEIEGFGYYRVLLMPGRKHFAVHLLVLNAFTGPSPKGMECRHFPDRNPGNNRVSNLRWGTRSQNMNDKTYHGTHRNQRGTKNSMAKVNEEMVVSIRRLHATGKYYLHDLADLFNIHKVTVWAIVHRYSWTHI